jgi:hypothetical protein
MRIYTVQRRPAPPEADPDVELVPEGFAWWAVLLPPVWLLWHRQWLGLAAYLAGAVLLGALSAFLGPATEAAIAIGYAVLVGATANDWRRWRLAARGYELEGVVAAGGLEEAEARCFAGLSAEAAATAPAARAPRPVPRRQQAASPLAPWSP